VYSFGFAVGQRSIPRRNHPAGKMLDWSVEVIHPPAQVDWRDARPSETRVLTLLDPKPIGFFVLAPECASGNGTCQPTSPHLPDFAF
jgi:hypothetical protein